MRSKYLLFLFAAFMLMSTIRCFGADCYLPLGDSVFDQHVACADTEEVSQNDSSFLGNMRVADDFRILESLTSPLLWVSWHGRYNDPNTVHASGFNFFIYEDSGSGTPTSPWDTTVIKSWTLPLSQVNETVACTGYPHTYEYCAEISDGGFTPVIGQTYWLVIQAELVSNLSEFWGWLPSASVLYSHAQYVAPDYPLGAVDIWTDTTNPAMAFSLYAEGSAATPTPTSPPTHTPSPTDTPVPTMTPSPTETPIPPPIPSTGIFGLLFLLMGVSAFLLNAKLSFRGAAPESQ